MDKDAFLNRGFTFQCPAWHDCKLHKILLTKVSFRHLCISRAVNVPTNFKEYIIVLHVHSEPSALCTISRETSKV